MPWTELENDNSAFIDGCYIPAGITLGDPEHLHKEKSTAILKHWRVRQRRGEIPLMFSHVQANKKLVEAYYKEGLLAPPVQNVSQEDNSEDERVVPVPVHNNHSSDTIDTSEDNGDLLDIPQHAAVQPIKALPKVKGTRNPARGKVVPHEEPNTTEESAESAAEEIAYSKSTCNKGKGRQIMESSSEREDEEDIDDNLQYDVPDNGHIAASSSRHVTALATAVIATGSSGVVATTVKSGDTVDGHGSRSMGSSIPQPLAGQRQNPNTLYDPHMPLTPSTMSPVPEDIQTPNNIPGKFSRKARIETPEIPHQQATPLPSQENTPVPVIKVAKKAKPVPRRKFPKNAVDPQVDVETPLVSRESTPTRRTKPVKLKHKGLGYQTETPSVMDKPATSQQTLDIAQQTETPTPLQQSTLTPDTKMVKAAERPSQVPGKPTERQPAIRGPRRERVLTDKMGDLDEKQLKSLGIYTQKQQGTIKVKAEPSTSKVKGKGKGPS